MPQDLWQYMSQEQLEQYYLLLPDPDAAAAHLAEVLGLPEYRFDARSAIKLDFAAYAIEFCKDLQFGAQRTASVFNVAQNLLIACQAGTAFGDAQATLKSQLLELVSPKPGLDSPLLSPDHVAKVGQFMADTFFRHFRLYSYVFSADQDHTVYTADLLVETPITQPLESSMIEVDWHAHHAGLAAQAEADAAAVEAAAVAEVAAIKAAADAAERAEAQARIEEELKRKPATLEEAIEHMVAVRLDEAKAILARDMLKQQQEAAKAAAIVAAAAAAAAALAAPPPDASLGAPSPAPTTPQHAAART